MTARVSIVDRIIIAIAIQVQAVGGVWVQVGSIVGRDKPAPLGAVIPGVAVVETGIIVVVVATVANGVGVSDGGVGGLTGNGTVTPGIVQILHHQIAVGIVNCLHIALQVPLEVIPVCHAAGGILHADNTAFVIQEDDALVSSALVVEGLGDGFREQTAGMIVVVLLAIACKLTGIDGISARSALQIGIGLGDPLAKGIIAVVEVGGAGSQGAAGQPGQSALGPGSGLAFVGSGAAHGIVANGGAAEAGQLVSSVAEGSGSGVAGNGAGGRAYILPFLLSVVKKKPPRCLGG